MNIRIDYYDEQELSYSGRAIQHNKKTQPVASRRQSVSRRGKAPVQVNGIHRRRNRKLSW